MIQIEYFANDNLTNLISILSIRPRKVCFIYDDKVFQENSIKKLYDACKEHIKDLSYETYRVDINNLDEIYNLTLKLIPANEKCVIDLTGGGDLMTIAGYKAGINNNNATLVYVDMYNRQVINIKNNEVVVKVASITLKDYFTSIGAILLPSGIESPKSEEFDKIHKMAMYIFNNISQWRKTSNYLQRSLSWNEGLEFGNSRVLKINNSKYRPSEKLLRYSEELGFINDLKMDNRVRFSFPSTTYKQYMTNFGIWLELFVYIESHKIKNASEIIHSAVIDWVSDDGVDRAGNEIDVLLNIDSVPVSISCKLTDPDIEAVNEIQINKLRIAGRKGKGILVAFSSFKQNKTSTYYRAVELGIGILDKGDILSGNFAQRLEGEILI